MSGHAIRYTSLRWLIVIAGLLWLVGGAIEHIAPASSNVDIAHWSATITYSSAVNPDHLQCGDDIALSCPFLTAVADMTSGGNALLALGAMCAFVAAYYGSGRHGQAGLRAPPRGGAVLAGRGLLTRLCLSQR